jgi:geranylgeranyl pyrophosphate synthase
LALLAAGHSPALVQARQAAESFAIGYQIYDDLQDVEKDAARNLQKNEKSNSNTSACNIVLILQADSAYSGPRDEAKKIGLQHLLQAASSSTKLPARVGEAIHSMAMELHEKLRNQQ